MFGCLKNVITGYSLLLLIGIPSFLPALHELFHYHEHLHCTATASEVHLHAAVHDCDLCDFLTKTPFYSDIVQDFPSAERGFLKEIIQTYQPAYIEPFPGAQYLRGPPSLDT